MRARARDRQQQQRRQQLTQSDAGRARNHEHTLALSLSLSLTLQHALRSSGSRTHTYTHADTHAHIIIRSAGAAFPRSRRPRCLVRCLPSSQSEPPRAEAHPALPLERDVRVRAHSIDGEAATMTQFAGSTRQKADTRASDSREQNTH